MVRLTVDVINHALAYVNPLKERELDLRGNKIPSIENLGAAKSFDAMDLTDNVITTLGNFPLSPRLNTLLLSHNRIASISANLPETLPNLTTLQLGGNRLAELADLDPLARCRRLTHLVLAGCPVADKQHYRAWVLWRIPSVRYLDFSKVKDAERAAARELFGDPETAEMTPLAAKIAGVKSRVGAATFDASAAGGADGSAVGRVKFTDAERARLQKLIENAKSQAELDRLMKMMAEGRVPADADMAGT